MPNAKRSKKSLNSTDVEVSLKHFIYLDRERLKSYSSQLLNGIVQMHRFSENRGSKTTESSPDISETHTSKTEKSNEVSVGPKNTMGAVAKKNTTSSTKSHIYIEKGLIEIDNLEKLYSKDVEDYDNSYLDLETKLIEHGLLVEVNKSIPISKYPRLVKLRGTARFFDWNTFKVLSTIGKMADLSESLDINGQPIDNFLANTIPSNIYERCFSTIQEMLNAFSIGQITCYMKANGIHIASPLNEEHICMTIEQLRTSYVMSGDVQIVITGFIPSRAKTSSDFPGIAGQVNMSDIAENILGQDMDLVIEPIAIYTEIKS